MSAYRWELSHDGSKAAPLSRAPHLSGGLDNLRQKMRQRANIGTLRWVNDITPCAGLERSRKSSCYRNDILTLDRNGYGILYPENS